MKLKQLESALQNVETFKNPKLNYEQYITTSHLASQILFNIDNQYDDINESIVCELGIGTGMLSIGCSLLDANLIYGIDIDADALSQCKENINEFEINNIELVNADCKQLLKSYELKTQSILFENEFDMVIMNPPFGTKYQSNQIFEKEVKQTIDENANEITNAFALNSTLGIDMQFLKLASKLTRNSIYSLNKSCTRDFIRKFSASLGLNMEILSELRYNIPKVEPQNVKSRSKTNNTKKPDKDIEVDFIRFSYT